MGTIGAYTSEEDFSKVKGQLRTTIETAFFRNNVVRVASVGEAYNLAKNSPGTIELTGMPVYKPVEQGLPEDACVLLFNDGAVYGRCAAARRIIGEAKVSLDQFAAGVREAVYHTRMKKMYHAQVLVGLSREFMVKAHLLIPERHENIMYSWMLNFQSLTEEILKVYKESEKLPEGDIYIFSDPDWSHPDFPLGLTLFDPEHNCAALLGMRYFGEHKKGTLTLAWGTATRNNYASCHGGLKRYNLDKDAKYTVAVFGLSGSGKSTITHAKHKGKFDVTVLHDDAFVVDIDSRRSIALEPTYFDKTQDYPLGSEDNKYLLTMQNNGAVMGDDGLIYPITEDLRNGNGRAVKSRFWTPNRVNKIEDPINAVFWLMKDSTLPPVVKLNGAALGSVMGATLATKRTTAERLAPGVDPDALVIEPYANPFRTYPLVEDFKRFKKLLENNVDCYILNTGHFMDKKVRPEHTLGVIEAIIEGTAEFVQWKPFKNMEILPMEGFDADLSQQAYADAILARLADRVNFLHDLKMKKGGRDELPLEAIKLIEELIETLQGRSSLDVRAVSA